MEDWEKKMQKIRDDTSKLLAKLNENEENSLLNRLDKVKRSESLLTTPEQHQFNEIFLRMVEQQNQFHERLLGKLDEIITALKNK